MTGFEMILPFLKPIQAYILDPDVSEIMVNGPQQVFIERAAIWRRSRVSASMISPLWSPSRTSRGGSATTSQRRSRSSTPAFRTAAASPPLSRRAA